MFYAVSTLVCTPNALSQTAPGRSRAAGHAGRGGRCCARSAAAAGFTRCPADRRRRTAEPGAGTAAVTGHDARRWAHEHAWPAGRTRRGPGDAGAALADALAGTGGLLLVTGEPGIGKSALLAEQAARAAAGRGAGATGRRLEWGGRAAVLALDPGAARTRTAAEPVRSARRSGWWRARARTRPIGAADGAGSGCSTRSRAPAGRGRAAGGGPRRPAVGRRPVAAAAGVRRRRCRRPRSCSLARTGTPRPARRCAGWPPVPAAARPPGPADIANLMTVVAGPARRTRGPRRCGGTAAATRSSSAS